MIFMPMRSGLAIAVTVLLSLACGTSQDPSFVDAERSPSYKIAVTVGEEDATAQGADGYQGSAIPAIFQSKIILLLIWSPSSHQMEPQIFLPTFR